MTRIVPVALLACLAFAAGAPAAMAGQVYANLFMATPDGTGAPIGSVIARDSSSGASLQLRLHGLPPGVHGFHVHHNGSCDAGMKDGMPVLAGKAGGHEDPDLTGRHRGPTGAGHLGDLPTLTVAPDGTDNEVLIAPRIREVTSLIGHSLVIHAGGDTYSDTPDPLGGGGPRIACGVIK